MSARKVLMTGNEAMAAGAIASGCRFYAGYPITPQNELTAYMASYMPDAGGVFIQAESEVAAVNMVYGASAAGARAMTSSSSPGISLKQEGISYLAGAELPAVIINVMRAGPGLGNIAPAQSDYFQATRGGGHGDYRCVVLAPASIQESYDLMPLAFDLADRYRMPVLILSDGMLGQMMEPLRLAVRGGRLASAHRTPLTDNRKIWALTGCAKRKPNIIKSFYMDAAELEKFNLSLQRKYRGIRTKEPRYEKLYVDDAQTILVAYGSMARIAKGVVTGLRNKGMKIGLIRPITLWPFPDEIFTAVLTANKKTSFFVLEMSYGQMIEDVKLAVNGKAPVMFYGRAGGAIPTEKEIIDHIQASKKSA